MATPPLVCPVCAALLVPGATATHIRWHETTNTLDGWVASAAHRLIDDNAAALLPALDARHSWPADDEAPTQKFPPIGETVLRRPPPPTVRELKGAELLRALADELAAYAADEDGEQ